ncbi:uncharacterized protein LOC115714307 isoform X2 [Cannabis sativa]|uniref:uncharacterized protein LOC115714307 isoform X2 n=1 Tax=Cannabis sativa TaxID=3483 RepID=UPI0029CA8916|nr:uncharacterized protein LOC115714307 isoform X2 [Cannabis sativa]
MGKQRKELRKKLIMVGIDESELSYDALIWVLENLKESFKDNHLFIFATQSLTTAVLPSLGLAHFHFHLSPTMDLISQNQQQNMKISLGLLEKSKRICAKHGRVVILKWLFVKLLKNTILIYLFLVKSLKESLRGLCWEVL